MHVIFLIILRLSCKTIVHSYSCWEFRLIEKDIHSFSELLTIWIMLLVKILGHSSTKVSFVTTTQCLRQQKHRAVPHYCLTFDKFELCLNMNERIIELYFIGSHIYATLIPYIPCKQLLLPYNIIALAIYIFLYTNFC